jgi:hypothetical protein
MIKTEAEIIHQEPTDEQPHDLATSADKTLNTYADSHLPFPIIAAIITFLATATTFVNLHEAAPFVAVSGTTATLIFAAESVILSRHRRIRESNKPQT